MVTKERFERYKERKGKTDKDEGDIKEEDVHEILDKIAEMRFKEKEISMGKEKLIEKMKVRPIVRYVEDILEKKYGFRPIKKGEKYFRVKSGKPTAETATKRISPMQQYIDMLGERKMAGFKAIRKYNEWIAVKKEGFDSYEEKEEYDAAELGLSIEEYHDILAKNMGFDSYEEYLEYISDIYEIRERYASIIPQQDFIDVFKMLKEEWMKNHEKFIMFCNEFWKDVLKPFLDKNPNTEAAVLVDNITKELEKFHQSRPGSLHIYSVDDIAIGMSHCLEDKDVDAILSKDKKYMKFRKVNIAFRKNSAS